MTSTAGKDTDSGVPKERLPKGQKFMPRVCLKRLARTWKDEPAGKSKQVLEACRRRKEGQGIHSMAREMGMNYSTVQGWLARMHPGNLDRRFDRKSTGRRRVLPAAVLKYVEKLLDCSPQKYKFEAGSWQINMVMELIMKKFGMTCNSHTLKRAMRRMGFSYSKPRPIPDKSASEEEQEKFKQETADMIRAAGRQGYVVRVCDEAAVQIWSDAKYGWRRAGGHDTVRIGFSKKSAKLIGSLGSDGYRIRAIDAINSETFIEFLQDLLKTYPKLILVMDNASCHRSKMVAEFVESTGGAIRLVFLPPYTPQLNPVEMQWGALKRLLSGRYFQSVERLKETVTSLVESGEMKPVRLMSYLTP